MTSPCDGPNMRVERVAPFLYVWHLSYKGHNVVGYGTKGQARRTMARFLNQHGKAYQP